MLDIKGGKQITYSKNDGLSLSDIVVRMISGTYSILEPNNKLFFLLDSI